MIKLSKHFHAFNMRVREFRMCPSIGDMLLLILCGWEILNVIFIIPPIFREDSKLIKFPIMNRITYTTLIKLCLSGKT